MHTEAPINVFVQELRHCGINAEALHEHQANPESLDKYSAFYKEFEQGEIEVGLVSFPLAMLLLLIRLHNAVVECEFVQADS